MKTENLKEILDENKELVREKRDFLLGKNKKKSKLPKSALVLLIIGVIALGLFLKPGELSAEENELGNYEQAVIDAIGKEKYKELKSEISIAISSCKENDLSAEQCSDLIKFVIDTSGENIVFALEDGISIALEEYGGQGSNPEQIINLIKKVTEIAGGFKYNAVLHVVPNSLKAYKKQGLSSEQSINLITKVAEATKEISWYPLVISAPVALETGLSQEQIVIIIKKVSEGTGENSGDIFETSLPTALRACKEHGLSPEQTVDLIIKIIEASGEDAGYELDSLPNTLKACRDQGLSPEESINLIIDLIDASGWYSDSVLEHTVPAALEADLNSEQTIDLIKKVINISGKHAKWALEYTVPAALEADLTPKQTIDLIKKVIDASREENTDRFFTDKILVEGIPNVLSSSRSKDAKIMIQSAVFISKYSTYQINVFRWLFKQGNVDSDLAISKDGLTRTFIEASNNIAENDGLTKQQSSELAVLINTLHDNEVLLDNSDSIRTNIAKGLSTQTKYDIMSQGGGDLYTSTFEKLYENLDENYIEQISNYDPEGKKSTEFVLTLANFNVLKNEYHKNPEFFNSNIRNSLSVQDEEELIRNTALMITTFGSIFSDNTFAKYNVDFEKFFITNYESSQSKEQRGSYGYLIKLNKNKFSEDNKKKADSISNFLPEIILPGLPQTFAINNVVASKLYFYDDEPWFGITRDQYIRSHGFKKISESNNGQLVVLEKLYKGKTLRMILSLDNSDVQEAVDDPNIQLVSHRGHSFHLRHTFNGRSDAQKILYLGSCGSFRETPSLQKDYPNAYFISDENTGQGSVNNAVIYQTMLNIANGVTDLETIANNIKTKFKTPGVVFPHEKSQLLRRFIDSMKE
ncbi:hypothetical protein ACFL0W_06040 [Nanoarchaeota archaeon]